jgi:hypothetical protein
MTPAELALYRRRLIATLEQIDERLDANETKYHEVKDMLEKKRRETADQLADSYTKPPQMEE